MDFRKDKKKIVGGFDIFFKDDFSIIKSEISRKLALPKPYILNSDELLIIYSDFLFTLSETSSFDNGYIKIYTQTYGIINKGPVQNFEEKYFVDNVTQIHDLKKKFIESCIDVPPYLKKKVPDIGRQIGKELAKKIEEAYPKPIKAGGSILSQLGYDKIIILDEKLYDLITIPEFLKKYRNSFEPTFFNDLENTSKTATPEEVSEILTKNRDKVHEKVLPIVRDKIWCNEKSGKIFLDGRYFIAEYRGRIDNLADAYMRMLERKIKLDAAEEFQKMGMI